MIRAKTASGMLALLQHLLPGAFLIISVLLTACSREAATLLPEQRETIQSRVTNSFAYTVLFKPIETETNAAPALRLAPLILQEVTDTNAAALWRDQFGSGASGPMVHAESASVVVNSRTHEQYWFTWRYPSQQTQGIRLTLNAAGEPVIWEVLADSTGADILYVAQSLELAARAEFGPPLPGRKFSIERSLTEAPRTVVANVIDDGPLPMGPVVYLRQESRDVSTLICRCMASQGGTLLGQTNYELRVNSTQTNRPAVFRSEQLEQRLRLPRSF